MIPALGTHTRTRTLPCHKLLAQSIRAHVPCKGACFSVFRHVLAFLVSLSQVINNQSRLSLKKTH